MRFEVALAKCGEGGGLLGYLVAAVALCLGGRGPAPANTSSGLLLTEKGRASIRPVSGRAPAVDLGPGLPPFACSDQVFLRHPKVSTYRCFLPDLTGFAVLRRAGPGLQRRVTLAVSECLDLEREFNPAIAGCGFRAPLAPRLARSQTLSPAILAHSRHGRV